MLGQVSIKVGTYVTDVTHVRKVVNGVSTLLRATVAIRNRALQIGLSLENRRK